MNWTKEEVNSFNQEVIKRSMSDTAFREKLLSNPNQAIEEVIGHKLPEGFSLKVIESDPSYNATFVLPDFIGNAVEDDDLENVAGGIDSETNGIVLVTPLSILCLAAFGPCAIRACGFKM